MEIQTCLKYEFIIKLEEKSPKPFMITDGGGLEPTCFSENQEI